MIIGFLVVGLPIHLLAQTFQVVDNEIIIGRIDSIYSATLDEYRHLWISVPESAENDKSRFPVVYVLDGNAHFYSLVGMIRQLSTSNGNTVLPEMIVVGITNTDRARDLTPSEVSYIPNSGGAEHFTTFLSDELIPYINSTYPTTSHRTLVGHSWGGLYVLNTLINHEELFASYISIDPTIRWNNLVFASKACQYVEKHKFDNRNLYLAMANRLPGNLDLNTVMDDTLKSSEHMRIMLQFSSTCENATGLNFESGFYENDNHTSVPLIATYDALRYLFQWYGFNEEILFDGSNRSAEELLDIITKHYENVADQFGYPFMPPERMIRRFGDITLSERKYEHALALYQMNIDSYPESARAYESMGDYYRSLDQDEKAKDFYLQSLEIEETSRVLSKLGSLESR